MVLKASEVLDLKMLGPKELVFSNIKMLGVHIDSKLNFNLHIDIICKSASNQQKALV